MPVHLPPHKHCPNCDDPMSERLEYCSEQCMVDHAVKRKRGSARMKLFYVGAAAALVLIWVLSFI